VGRMLGSGDASARGPMGEAVVSPARMRPKAPPVACRVIASRQSNVAKPRAEARTVQSDTVRVLSCCNAFCRTLLAELAPDGVGHNSGFCNRSLQLLPRYAERLRPVPDLMRFVNIDP
jgi:hypothetical protein